MLFRSTKMRYHKNAFGELANYSETPLNNIFSGPENGKCVPTFLSRIHHDQSTSGPRLNIKTVLSMYGDFHVKDKTAVRTSLL